MIVRRMQAAELEATARLWHEVSVATYRFLPTERDRTWEERHAYFESVIAAENEIWVALDGGGLVGFLAIRGEFIDRLYVHAERQRGGAGSALLAQARTLSPAGLRLFTHQANTGARAFYEQAGFVAVRFGLSPAPESAPDVEYRWRPGGSIPGDADSS